MTRRLRVGTDFTEAEHQQLSDMAAREQVPVARVLGRIVRAHLATGQVAPPPTAPVAGPPPPPPVLASTAGGFQLHGTPPPWLEPDDPDRRQEWTQVRQESVADLLDRYPQQFRQLRDDWNEHPIVCEQLWAFSFWRDQLDTGVYEDPRMELAFANALRQFAAFLEEHRQAVEHAERQAVAQAARDPRASAASGGPMHRPTA